MKRLLPLLLCGIFLLSASACGADPAKTGESTEPAQTANQGSSGTAAAPSEASDSGTKKPDAATSVWGDYVFDTETDHKFLAMDIKNHSIVVLDLNRCRGNLDNLTKKTAVVWEWDSDTDPNCKIKPQHGIDSAKLRYSAYYKKDVIIACSSNGWAGVIDYEKKTVLWEYKIGSGPHSIEMMPNGDVVVAGSGGNGILAYVPLSAGVTAPSHSVVADSGHGVCWDPQNQCLWVLESSRIACFTVQNQGTPQATLQEIKENSVTLARKDTSGHVLSPVTGQPGLYWVAGAAKLMQFDANTRTLTTEFPMSAALTHKEIKGNASFADGITVQTFAKMGGNTSYDWSSKGIRVVLQKTQADGSVRPVTKEVIFQSREFYKVFPFSKDYQ